jgi:hypothetical protein
MVKRIQMNRDKDEKKRKQIIPRPKLYIPPHRHQALQMCPKKHNRRRERVKKMVL